MRNTSTTFRESYMTDAGNVKIERVKRGLWSVMERGYEAFLVSSMQRAFQEARGIEARRARQKDTK